MSDQPYKGRIAVLNERLAELAAENERLSAKLSLAQGVADAVQARASRAALAGEAGGEPGAWINRLRSYGEAMHDGRNQGTLFRFKDGRWFFLADVDAEAAARALKGGEAVSGRI